MRDLNELFAALQQSSFRRRFALGTKERASYLRRGMSTVLEHAREFIARRLAPALPAHDGSRRRFAATRFSSPSTPQHVLPELPREVARDPRGPAAQR